MLEAPVPRLSFARCLGFRFACVYLVLYSLPFPLGSIPGTDHLAEAFGRLWNNAMLWLGEHLLHLRGLSVTPNGSGDTTFAYVELALTLALAAVLTLLWTALARPKRHETLGHWLRVYVRYVLAAALLSYGMFKVFKSQFPMPTPMRLMQPYGDSSPMGLLWTFMGFSTPYTMFVGAAEALGGLLLLFRRTTTLGALVALSVMTNVVMLNFCYDVPVKLYSVHLWLMAAFLLLPDVPRLADFFLRNKATFPAPPAPPTPKWASRARLALKVLFAGTILFLTTKNGYTSWKQYGDAAPRNPLDGAYDVEELIVNRTPVGTATPLSRQWRRVGISTSGRLTVRAMDESVQRYRLENDPKSGAFTVWPDTSAVRTRLAYRWRDASHLDLRGALAGDSVSVRLRKVATADFPLLSRGFHWINEFPYNK
jgi:uncharacterized membrane protein YphA (DoxX/SURF4 family)